MSVMVQIRNDPDEQAHELKIRTVTPRMGLSDFLVARLTEMTGEPASTTSSTTS